MARTAFMVLLIGSYLGIAACGDENRGEGGRPPQRAT